MTSANRLAADIRSETSLIGYPLLNKKERHAFYAKLLAVPLISFASLFNHPFHCDHRSVVWPHSSFYLTSARSRLTHTSLCWMCLNQAINRTKKLPSLSTASKCVRRPAIYTLQSPSCLLKVELLVADIR